MTPFKFTEKFTAHSKPIKDGFGTCMPLRETFPEGILTTKSIYGTTNRQTWWHSLFMQEQKNPG